MYRIITPTGETHLTEKPNFIKKHTNDCFILVSRSEAEGVAYNGTPYLFADGTMVAEIDAGSVYMTIDEMAAAIKEGVNEV